MFFQVNVNIFFKQFVITILWLDAHLCLISKIHPLAKKSGRRSEYFKRKNHLFFSSPLNLNPTDLGPAFGATVSGSALGEAF